MRPFYWVKGFEDFYWLNLMEATCWFRGDLSLFAGDRREFWKGRVQPVYPRYSAASSAEWSRVDLEIPPFEWEPFYACWDGIT